MQKEIKYGGFYANPNDHDGLEGDLAVAMNLIPEDNTIKPVLPPLGMAPIPGDPNLPNSISRKILCIHKTTEFIHYIVAIEHYSRPGNFFYLYWWDGTEQGQLTRIGDVSYQDIISVEPVGNTLFVLTSEGVHYLLWDLDNRDNYKYLGQKPPRIDITFGLDSEFVAYPWRDNNGKAMEPMKIIYQEPDEDEQGGGANYESSYGKVILSESDMSAVPTGKWTKMLCMAPKEYAETDPDWGGMVFWKGDEFSMENQADPYGYVARATEILSNQVIGAINKLVNSEGTKKGRFFFPFFVRYAYRMYDGSHIMHSYPVLMVPNSRGPVFALDGEYSTGGPMAGRNSVTIRRNGYDVWLHECQFAGRAYAFASKLHYEADTEALDDWRDIIHGVDVFVSQPAYTFNQAGKSYGWKNMDDKWDQFYTIGKTPGQDYKKHLLMDSITGDLFTPFNNGVYVGPDVPSFALSTEDLNEEEMKDKLLSSAVFYKIFSFDIDEINVRHKEGVIDIEKGTLETLLASETLKDDFLTRDMLIAKTSFAYNNRVNLAGVSRIQHKPLDAHIAWAKYMDGSNASWNIAVKVKGQDRTNVLVSGSGQNDTPMPLFVFYPDPNATVAYVERGGVTHELKLARHPVLWGAYWLGSLWSDADVPTTVGFPSDNEQPIKEYNTVYTSKVNNPFYFPSVNTITTGEIMALCAAVRPVSTGQVGYADLYIFADNGVWVAKINDEGYYSNVTLVTGDICINPDSVTQMETTVLFTAARGIMLISGSQAQCISEAIDDKGMAVEPVVVKRDGTAGNYIHQLYGVLGIDAIDIRPFREFLGNDKSDGCRMTYDYRGQRIIVYNPAKKDGASIYPYAYIYSLQSNKWGMMQADIDYTLRAYPDAIAVNNNGMLVNYSERGSVEGGSADVCQLLVTRPLALDLPDVLKTVRVVMQRGMFNMHAKRVQCALYASRDLYNWHLVMSSVDHSLRGFSGTPYKWFRVAVLLHLQPNEALTGCTIQFEPRQTNRLR